MMYYLFEVKIEGEFSAQCMDVKDKIINLSRGW